MIAAPASGLRSAAALFAAFGDRLSLVREDDRAVWHCDGRRVVVELEGDGGATATFVDLATIDHVSGEPVCAAYRGASRYRLSGDGAHRMAGDIADFFGGTREPGFAFVGTLEPGD